MRNRLRNPHTNLRPLSALLALVLLTLSPTGVLTQTPQIPAHPRELKYTTLTYTPPKRDQYRHVLSNGVVAYLVEDHDLPLVNVSILVRTGSYLDPAGKEGLAALTGTQMRVGGTTSKTAEEFDEAADFLAANIINLIGPTQGNANLNLLAKDVDQGLALYFDMTKASIDGITREDMIAFHQRYYQPAGFIFAVSGDFKTKDMLAKLETATKGWLVNKQAVPAVPKPTNTLVAGVYAVHKGDVNQGRVSIGHTGALRDSPDAYALEIMNDILGGGGFTSRITSRVRSDEGLAYSAGSNFGLGVYYPGNFRASFQSKNPTTSQAIDIVMEEINRLRTTKVTNEELETAKNSAIEVFPRIFATAAQVASTFAQDEYTKRPADYWTTYRDRIRAITADDVQRVAQKYLQPDKLVVLVVGNIDEISKGNPDKPQYSLAKIAKDGQIRRIPLPDPLTLIYPSTP
ncbi:MAG: insulinase family protein [Acidobacteria bacterium]|nr:insulinase family protein [Acidobacteriota bacterium]